MENAVNTDTDPSGLDHHQTDRSQEQATDTQVLFNADCPVCNFEIRHYAKYTEAQDLPVRFEDLNTCELSRWGVTADQAARRLYVRKGDKLLSGIEAFLVLWQEMPRYRWLARLIGLPVIRQGAVLIYDNILAPILYRAHLRRVNRG